MNQTEEALLLLFKKLMPKACIMTMGTVSEVNKENKTCTVERDEQPTLFNCRLNATIDELESYVVAYPVIGSYVLCATLTDITDCVVLSMTAIEAVDIKVGKSQVQINEEDILLNGGALGGLIKISEFTDKLNEFVKSFNTHTHMVNTSGSATAQTGTADKPLVQAADFVAADYENEKIKQ